MKSECNDCKQTKEVYVQTPDIEVCKDCWQDRGRRVSAHSSWSEVGQSNAQADDLAKADYYKNS